MEMNVYIQKGEKTLYVQDTTSCRPCCSPRSSALSQQLLKHIRYKYILFPSLLTFKSGCAPMPVVCLTVMIMISGPAHLQC